MTCNCSNDECKSMYALYEVCKADLDSLKEKHDQMMASKQECTCENEGCKTIYTLYSANKKSLAYLAEKHKIVLADNKTYFDRSREEDLEGKTPEPISRYQRCGCSRVECQQYFSSCMAWERKHAETKEKLDFYFENYKTLNEGNRRADVNWNEMKTYFEKKLHDNEAELRRIAGSGSYYKSLYEDLVKTRENPFCRDSKIKELMEETAKAKKSALYYNDLNVRANRSEELNQKDIAELKNVIKTHEKTISDLQYAITERDEVIEALKTAMPDELERSAFDICHTVVCKRKLHVLNMMVGSRNTDLRELEAKHAQLKDALAKAEQDRDIWKIEHDKAIKGDCEMLREAALERPVEVVGSAQRRIDLVPMMDTDLKMLFETLFVRTGALEKGIEETKLYDDFIMDQPPSKRLDILKSMYSACHDGRPMPEQESRRFHDNAETSGSGRVAKQSFAACLKAIGGISKKKGTRSVWLNIRVRHPPCFANRFAEGFPRNSIL